MQVLTELSDKGLENDTKTPDSPEEDSKVPVESQPNDGNTESSC